ncbi:nicotinamide-nucleotide amidase [Pseudogulbenkiania subflava]|uniref:Nicotinamide-nucleotide amidase n=1 Tax=Pseudogulbenkiania subflava DSM 22618 TaxID=1123014 RepID=A0A1Y6BMY0_9NEIS|nr:nicotinamide-nucleotide amidase [Pseudogulbenkiania subflava]SMF11167.1 nicotinamide-nucleotide amidase [Pseudogulbenkiania subflava DSM 22618]
MSTEMALARQLGELLLDRGERLTLAESCTAGRIAGAVTDIAGSSAWFGYGFVTYSNEAKQQMLGVRAETLAEDGAVSERTVREMAAGALQRSGADWAVAVSGIAGPAGGSAAKPVGTVWFALAGCQGAAEAFACHFSGDRLEVRRQTVETALTRLIQLIDRQPLSA